MHTPLLRAVGTTTAVYGALVTARPALLARPSGLTTRDGAVPRDTETCLRPLAWRDLAVGLAMATAPEGPALRTATAVRIAADLGDALLLGPTLDRAVRPKVLAVSVGWATLSVLGLCARRAR
ncbi:hypothetical protein [Streptomyces diastaticus]|uniref:hypothetical protein n=1 Tax=Streptomyces diastaticus TaxID=1956 RepID=UPI0035D59B6A